MGGRPPAAPDHATVARSFRVSVVIGFSLTEIRNEVFADFSRRIVAGVGIEAFPIPKGFEFNQPEGKQHPGTYATRVCGL